MKLTFALKTAKEIADLGETALAIAVHDEMAEYDYNFKTRGYAFAQKKLTATARVYLGLGFSEFFADGDTDADYLKAAEKKNTILKALGIDGDKLYAEIERLYGR